MDDPEMPSSPRKKLKMESIPRDGSIISPSAAIITKGVAESSQSLQDPEPTELVEHKMAASLLDVTGTNSIAPSRFNVHDMQIHKEEGVGITEFVNPELPGFTGVLKKRYTDFLVNEILPSGQVVYLDNLRVPKAVEKKEPTTKTTETAVGTANGSSGAVEPNSEAGSGVGSKPDTVENTVDIQDANITGPRTDNSVKQVSISEASAPPEPVTKENVPPGPADTTPVKQDDSPMHPPVQELAQQENGITVNPNSFDAVSNAVASDTVLEASRPEPTQLKSETAGSVSQWQSYAAKPPDFQLSLEDADLMNSFFPSDIVRDILALFNRVINSPHRKVKEYGTVRSGEIADRDLRTKIHQAIRRIFSSRLESYTDDKGAVTISAATPAGSTWGTKGNSARNPGGRNNDNRSKKLGWKELGGEYLHFTLYKENKDTMEVVSYLARSLKMKPQSFQFAGTKDRRGVTVQRVSVHRVFADRMISVGRTLRNAKIGNFEYQPYGLELGELTGNEFVITLRDCDFEDVSADDIEARLAAASRIVETASQQLRERGYLNYYGLQRFGTFSTRTDTIGLKMLQGDFKAAVDAILHFNPTSLSAAEDPPSGHDMVSSDDKLRAYAINLFKTTGKSHQALEKLPRKFSAESNIIRQLGHSPNDYLGALQTIPRNLRLMYVHAYQSLIWNLAASQRWKEHSSHVLAGDLVLIEEHKSKTAIAETTEHIDADGDPIISPAPNDTAAGLDDRFTRARALTQEEVDSGKFSIFDIVLPTPGYDILYPDYLVKTYESIMAGPQGGGLDPHDMRRPWKDISLSGSYRKILSRPLGEIGVEVRAYADEDEQFVETDLDRLVGSRSVRERDGGSRGVGEGGEIGNAEVAVREVQNDEGTEKDKIAVILKLQLGSSQYATMALRELMKLGGVKTYKPDFGGGR